jgi:hypothetical protein
LLKKNEVTSFNPRFNLNGPIPGILSVLGRRPDLSGKYGIVPLPLMNGEEGFPSVLTTLALFATQV